MRIVLKIGFRIIRVFLQKILKTVGIIDVDRFYCVKYIFFIKSNFTVYFVSNGDSIDWKELGVQAEIDKVLNHKHLGNGSIILFHNDAKYTPECLDTIIKGLKEKGFEIVPISQLIHKDNYYMDVEGRQILNS